MLWHLNCISFQCNCENFVLFALGEKYKTAPIYKVDHKLLSWKNPLYLNPLYICYITCVMLCYITFVMLCYITCVSHVMLYNIWHVMLYNICYAMLYNICYVILYNIKYVMLWHLNSLSFQCNCENSVLFPVCEKYKTAQIYSADHKLLSRRNPLYLNPLIICYITCVMLCYIAFVMLLYSIFHVMLYNICHDMLYNICHVVI